MEELNVQLVSCKATEFKEMPENDTSGGVEYRADWNANAKDTTVTITLGLNVVAEKGDIASIRTETVFSVPGLGRESLLKLLDMLAGTAISTSRGLLLGLSTTKAAQAHPLPLRGADIVISDMRESLTAQLGAANEPKFYA